MTVPALSVIIVNWNGRELLRDCLAALDGSRGLSFQTVVVDNGSADGSLEMVQAEFPVTLRIANRENLGFARAVNQGLEVACGRYRLLLNSDTRVAPDALAVLVRFMDDHPEAGACGPRLVNPDGSLQPSGRAFPNLARALSSLVPLPRRARTALAHPCERRDYAVEAEVDEVSGAALCVRAVALEQVGPLDEGFFFFGEDVDLCWRLREGGWRVHYVPQAVVTHVWGGSHEPRTERFRLLAQRASVRLMRKHRPGLPAACVAALAFVVTLARALRSALPWPRRGSSAMSWRAYLDELAWLLRT
jgi:hypothetical protein